jgi:transglutaminase-like putative cysteine protease
MLFQSDYFNNLKSPQTIEIIMRYLKILILFYLGTVCIHSKAQHYHGFSFGTATLDELSLKVYSKDTTAASVVLDEFGEAYIDNGGENNLLLEYHVKIKILKTEGLDQANFRILLRKNGSTKEFIREVEGFTYNVIGGSLRKTPMPRKSTFTTSLNEYRDESTFTLPEVQVGSVIEVRYILESPFIFNFYPWRFQSEIPKQRSEFWARIPANYVYNISLKGFLNLSKNESSVVSDCYTPGGGNKADCSLYKYAITDIPALKDEDYMLSRTNFLAGIDYELSEVKTFDGRTIKYTKTWKDAVRELNTHESFGIELRKGRNLWEQIVQGVIAGKATDKDKAVAIYNLVNDWFLWNEYYGKYTELGSKKSYDLRKGNVGDINLSLVAALQSAGLQAEPVILATREAGLPNQLYPVISDFNYVVASVLLDGEYFLLDATTPLLPFGLLPRRCLNGTGRLIPRKEEDSKWIDLKPREKEKKLVSLNLKLENGEFAGEMTITSYGYEALDKRRELAIAGSVEKYSDELEKRYNDFEILDYKVENEEDLAKPIIEKFKLKSSLEMASPDLLYLNPFFVREWKSNPFKTNERLYPVDFGAPLETTYLLNLEYPQEYAVDELPTSTALALPQNGGKYLCNITNTGNKISLTSVLAISKSVYSSVEYHSLKELFNRIVSTEQSQIVLKRK